MRPIRRPACFVIACLIGLLTGGSSLSATDDPKLREILDKHWEAMGGMSNWSKVESIRLSGTIERDGQVVDIVIVKKRPNQIRATVSVPLPETGINQLQIIRAHDGSKGWTATRLPGAKSITKEELPTKAATELLADAGVMPILLKLWQSGAEITLHDPDEINGADCFVVSTRLDPDLLTTFYICRNSFELIGYKRLDPQGQPEHTWLEAYETHSGVKLPKITVIESPKTGRSVVSINSFEVGVGIYDDYFIGSEPPSTTSR